MFNKKVVMFVLHVLHNTPIRNKIREKAVKKVSRKNSEFIIKESGY